MTIQRPSMVRPAAFRKSALSLAKAGGGDHDSCDARDDNACKEGLHPAELRQDNRDGRCTHRSRGLLSVLERSGCGT
jgi:hypothetical protein